METEQASHDSPHFVRSSSLCRVDSDFIPDTLFSDGFNTCSSLRGKLRSASIENNGQTCVKSEYVSTTVPCMSHTLSRHVASGNAIQSTFHLTCRLFKVYLPAVMSQTHAQVFIQLRLY
jgi:hypothetical protein